MSTTFAQSLAVASLVGHCESIAAGGLLTEPSEQSLRLLIAQTLQAFSMPSIAEIEPAPAPEDAIDDADYVQIMNAVESEIGASA